MQRLQQLMSAPATGPKPQASNLKAALPADRSLGFAQRVQEATNGALLRCEERYPSDSPHSVLVVIVERDAVLWREKLAPLHNDFFGREQSDPLAPTLFEVIDRATDEAIQRLVNAGLLKRNTRASRELFPTESTDSAAKPLSPEDRAKADAQRAVAARKLKMARLLGEGGLTEEARPALLEAIHAAARALAVENRLPDPDSLADALLPPLSLSWNGGVESLRTFAADAGAPWESVYRQIQSILANQATAVGK